MRAPLPVLALSLALAACPGPRAADHPTPRPDVALEVARLEAARGDGVDPLIALAAPGGDPATREAALRALGRVGGPRALDALITALADPTPAIATRAAAAIGVLAATSELPAATSSRAGGALLATLARPGVAAPVVIEAIGRAADGAALAPLAGRVGERDAAVAEAAAIALGRFGRRDLPIDAAARAALVAAATGLDRAAVQRAAVWALGREHRGDAPTAAPEVTTALVAAITATDAETRAQAIAALARRKEVGAGAAAIEQALRDPDWRVAVEAVRALAGDGGTDAGRDAVAAIVVRGWAQLAAGGAPTQAHVVLEGLRALGPAAARPAVQEAFAAIASAAAPGTAVAIAPLVRGWAHCLAIAGLERAAPAHFDGGSRLAACGGDAITGPERAQLVAELIEAGVGTPAQRRDAIIVLLAAADAPRRASGLEAIAAAWPALDTDAREALVPSLTRSLAAPDAVEAGTAADTAGQLLARTDLSPAIRPALITALVERARAEADPELAGDLLAAIGTARLPEGRDACAAAQAGASPVIRAAAAACLAALAGDATAPTALAEPAAATPPAVDPATVIGRRVTWTVATSRGTVVIELRPAVAPWHVATIVALTRARFYDGLVFHRVVPDFVVQGGDPTGTGWGGPGYTLPAEPATALEAGAYAAGAVGIADAGKDSGGSQWFVMHARAPHLEGRYTKVGDVTRGQDVIDALVVGDRIVQATVTVD